MATAAALLEETKLPDDDHGREYRLMEQAVGEAYRAVECGDGNPFGAVIVRDAGDDDDGAEEEVVSCCHNMVRRNTDPSAHAEVTAIREACKRLGRTDLSDCQMYTSCQPCPMCLGTIYYSRIKSVVFGAKAEVAAAAGFEASTPDAFVEYYHQRSGLKVRQAQGGAARIAEQVFQRNKGPVN